MALREGGGLRDGRLSQSSLAPLKLFRWYTESQGRILDDWIIEFFQPKQNKKHLHKNRVKFPGD